MLELSSVTPNINLKQKFYTVLRKFLRFVVKYHTKKLTTNFIFKLSIFLVLPKYINAFVFFHGRPKENSAKIFVLFKNSSVHVSILH